MTLSYNAGKNTLSVTILQGVSNNQTHYVSSVQIKVNGSDDQTHYYTSQPDLISFTYEYTLITSNESIIEVNAIYIVGGVLTKTMGAQTYRGMERFLVILGSI